jgi:hypothetical protein
MKEIKYVQVQVQTSFFMSMWYMWAIRPTVYDGANDLRWRVLAAVESPGRPHAAAIATNDFIRRLSHSHI